MMIRFERGVDKYHRLLWEFDTWLRERYKYNYEDSDEVIQTYQEVRDKLWEYLKDENIDLYGDA